MSIKVITKDNFQSEVLDASKPVIVEFSATWCTHCKRLTPVLERLSKKLEGQIDIGCIDVDEQPSLQQQFDITVIPVLYLFKNGKHGKELIAPQSEADIESWINNQ